MLKSKCASTTNLLHTKFNANTVTKSVNFLPASPDLNDSLDDDYDDMSDSHSNSTYGQYEIVLNDDRAARLELDLAAKSTEISQLKSQLQTALDQSMRKREQALAELDEEKKGYERKLSEMRTHFSHQYTKFESNERQLMQERLNTLQSMYNELKFGYQNNLDNELKTLRAKLAESQNYSGQLIKELNKCNCRSKSQTKTVTTMSQTENSIGDVENLLKKSKQENNELKFKLEAERRQFDGEREKWLNEKQKAMLFQSYMQKNAGAPSFHSNGNVSGGGGGFVNKPVQAKKSLASHMQFLQQKLSLQQKQQQAINSNNQPQRGKNFV